MLPKCLHMSKYNCLVHGILFIPGALEFGYQLIIYRASAIIVYFKRCVLALIEFSG